MHNLLSSLTWWPLGGQLRMGQCLLSQIVMKRGVTAGLAEGDMNGKVQMCYPCLKFSNFILSCSHLL